MRAAHAKFVQLLRAIVRWRLVGLVGLVGAARGPPPLPPAAAPRPTLQQRADRIDVGDWGERELVEMYQVDCPLASPRRAGCPAASLHELQQHIGRGRRWYRWVLSIGATKVKRIAKYL